MKRFVGVLGKGLLWSLAAVGAIALTIVVWLYVAVTNQTWPRINHPEKLVSECQALATEYRADRLTDPKGHKPSDPGWNNRLATDHWPKAARELQPPPRFIRVDDQQVTIFQSAGAFGGWGVIVCVGDEPDACVKSKDAVLQAGVVATEHPRVFRFETDH